MKSTKLSLAGFAMIFMIFALPFTMSFRGGDKSAVSANELSQSFELPTIHLTAQMAYADEASVDQPAAPEVAPVENTGQVGGPEAGGVRAEAVEGETAEPTWFDKILVALGASSGIVAGLVMLFEFFLRLFPSKKPLSLLIPARYAFVSLASIFTFLGSVATALINSAQNSQEKPKA